MNDIKKKEELLSSLREFVASRMGLYFPKERLTEFERGLSKASRELGFEDMGSCARWLSSAQVTRRQIEILASHLTIGETFFFRDSNSFNLLETRILSELIDKRRHEGSYLRIWSAGCATGEEAYSLAILVTKMLPDSEKNWNISILATDINPTSLRKAAEGVYGEWSFRDVPASIKRRYFRLTPQGRFEVLPEIKEKVKFSYHNLAEDPYPSLLNGTNAIDIVFCRNVLMYFSKRKQEEVAAKLYRSVVEGGWLIVSPTEISSVLFAPFRQVHFGGLTLYKKDERSRNSKTSFAGKTVFGSHVDTSLDSAGEFHPSMPLSEPFIKVPEIADRDVLNDNEPDFFQDALNAYRLGRYSEAEEKLEALLAGGTHTGALSLLARILANMGRLAEARRVCERAIAADKLDPKSCYLLATILIEMGEREDAGKYLRRALYLDPDFILAHYAAGTLAASRGRAKEADGHFENALSLLANYRADDIVPESEGINVERMAEIIRSTAAEAMA